jgi:hypothetical protein
MDEAMSDADRAQRSGARASTFGGGRIGLEDEGVICEFCGLHMPRANAQLALFIRRECCEEKREFPVCEKCLEDLFQVISRMSRRSFRNHADVCKALRRSNMIYV